MSKETIIYDILKERNIDAFSRSIKQPVIFDGLLLVTLYVLLILGLCLW